VSRRPARLLAAALLASLAWPAWIADAAIPAASRIRAAAADRDRAAARVRTLALEVALQPAGAGESVASGTLLTSPDGASRLELMSEAGVIERQILSRGRRLASRDGARQAGVAPWLPPLYLLQAASGELLAGFLAELGVHGDRVALGYDGARDCYVLGGAVPGAASAWIDMESFDVVRIDLAGGTRYRLGPFRPFDGVLLPEWVEVETPGQPPARLEIRRGAAATAGPEAFAPSWLEAR
jgi:hypothetical protein